MSRHRRGLPTPHAITQRVRGESDGEDAYGNPIPAWGTVERPVYGWWTPGPGDEPEGVVDARMVADVAVVAPTFPVSPLDEFVVPGFDRPLQVVGLPQVYDNGPFGFQPGMRLNLRLVDQ